MACLAPCVTPWAWDMPNKRNWSSMIPPDLRARMDAVLGTRQRPLLADVWTELRDWLEAHEVEVPEALPVEREPRVGG